jgi:23S rRNA (cytidine1920-2'-O)/16S rRNA (cytidine1409-2'-O)-methyltransferase
MPLRRLDAELVRRGLAASPAEARAAVDAGRVTVAGVPATKVATMVPVDAPVAVTETPPPYVSRAGAKLAAGLERFDVDPAGRDCLDAGASTGGFTDCLLKRGAARVVAVDVGYGQLAWSLRSDPRVLVRDRTNVRDLVPDELPFAPDLVVADLSFVSLRPVLAPLAGIGSPGADHVVLVKPQFEARREEVEDGGVVRDPAVWRRAVQDVANAARAAGLHPQAAMASPVRRAAGNVEFLLHLTAGKAHGDLDLELDAAIEAGRELVR